MSSDAALDTAPEVRGRARALLEVLLVVALTGGTVLTLAGVGPGAGGTLARYSLAAAAWIYLPAVVILLRRRGFRRYGVTARAWRRSLRLAATTAAVVLPVYVLGFGLFRLRTVASELAPGAEDLAGLLNTALFLLLFVALPEEFFFRGYLQGELDRILGRGARLLGAKLGVGLPLAAAVFALFHLLGGAGAAGLLTFFPGLLFGWLRARSDGIMAPTLVHGAGNLVHALVVELVR